MVGYFVLVFTTLFHITKIVRWHSLCPRIFFKAWSFIARADPFPIRPYLCGQKDKVKTETMSMGIAANTLADNFQESVKSALAMAVS